MTAITTATTASTPATTGATAAILARDAALLAAGETLGQYKPYNSQIELAEIPHTRAVKVLYRNDPKLPAAEQKQSVYVRVPTKHLTEEVVASNIAELAPYVVAWLQGVEDSIIKEEHKAGLLSVYTEALSLEKLCEYLDNTAESSGRLNKEKIDAWFEDKLAAPLSLLFADKLGLNLDTATEADLTKLVTVLNAYKSKFSALANPKCWVKPEDRAAMIKVINECGVSEDSIGARFILRLTKMDAKQEETLLCL